MAATPAQLRRIKDPVARVAAAKQAMGEARQEYLAIIAEAVNELLADKSLAEVAPLLGVNRSRVFQMSRGL